MKAIKTFPNKVKHSSKSLSDRELELIEQKLHDRDYFDHAIYRLASILCEQLLRIGETSYGTVEN